MITSLTAGLIFLAAGLVQGLTGFGSALVALPLLALIMEVKIAVPLCMLNGLVITGYLSFQLRHHFSRKRILPLVLGSLPGILAGVTVLASVEAKNLRRLIGILLIGYSLYTLIAKPKPRSLHRIWGYIAGFFTGAIGAALSAGGPPTIIYTSLTDWTKEEIKATMTGFFVINGIITATVHAATGLTTHEVVNHLWVTAPLVFLGTVLGSLLTKFISRDQYIRLILLFLIIMGMMMFK